MSDRIDGRMCVGDGAGSFRFCAFFSPQPICCTDVGGDQPRDVSVQLLVSLITVLHTPIFYVSVLNMRRCKQSSRIASLNIRKMTGKGG